MKLKINHQFEKPDGSMGIRSKLEDFETLPRRIFIRIGKLMSKDDGNRTIIPGVNAYNYGKYKEALKWFNEAISICPQVKKELFPHIEICTRVISTNNDTGDFEYEKEISQWQKKPYLIKRLFPNNSPLLKIKCKYCGHYTMYIDPNCGFAYFGQNNCLKCGRGYPAPDFSWDGIDGQAYIYYRRSVTENSFYEEFENKYDVSPNHTYFLKK